MHDPRAGPPHTTAILESKPVRKSQQGGASRDSLYGMLVYEILSKVSFCLTLYKITGHYITKDLPI